MDHQYSNHLKIGILDNNFQYKEKSEGDNVRVAVLADVETTGLDLNDGDEIIELGLVKFEYNPDTGDIYGIVDEFNSLQMPSREISPEAEKITGLTLEKLVGHSIDEDEVNAFIADVDLVIAHNAAFDRPFIESQFPAFEDKYWACSLNDVDWADNGYRTRSLEFLAFKFGYTYESHRASNDCRATIHLLSMFLEDSEMTVMANLLSNARKEKHLVMAIKTAYPAKDALKARDYKWDGDQGFWYIYKESQKAVDVEIEWLNSSIYVQAKFKPETIPVNVVNGKTKYSKREKIIN